MKKQNLQTSLGAYPPFLTREEEHALEKRMAEGDFNAKEMLIEHNLRIVFFQAQKYAGRNAEFEDLVSIGSIGLIKAANSFDPEKKVRFATYASRCVKNEMLMYLRKGKNIREVPLEDQMHEEPGADEVWEEAERRFDRERIEKLIGLLPHRQQRIVELRFGLNGQTEHSQKDVAKMVGVSQSHVSKTEKKFVRILKENMVNDAQISEKM